MDFGYEFNSDFGSDFDPDFIEFIREEAKYFIPKKDEDYEINQENYSKMLIVFCLLKKISYPEFDTVYPVELVPRHIEAQVTADFASLNLNSKMKRDFEMAISLCDAVDIWAQTDGILHIELVIANVFQHK